MLVIAVLAGLVPLTTTPAMAAGSPAPWADELAQAIQDLPERVGYYINLLLISRHLERLADHATNIAEEVIYLVEGEIFRHAGH